MPSKLDIIDQLLKTHPALAHRVAAEHRGALYDITCQAPKCGEVVRHYFVEVPTTPRARAQFDPQADLRHFNCPGCGSRGQWKAVPSPAAPQSQVEAALEAIEQEKVEARKSRAGELKKQIRVLIDELDTIEPPEAPSVETYNEQIATLTESRDALVKEQQDAEAAAKAVADAAKAKEAEGAQSQPA